MNKWYVLIFIAFLGLLFYLFTNRGKVAPEVIIKERIDTVTIVRIDTVREYMPKYITERVIDTIYIEKETNNEIKLPITERYYKSDSYELWITGYKPELKAINVFNKTEYKYVTNETIKEIYPKQYSLYGKLGIFNINDYIVPTIGLELITPYPFSFEINVGYHKNKLAYNFGLGYKIFGK